MNRLASRFTLLAGLAVSAGSVAMLAPRPATAAIVERVVAIVGEQAILLSDLRERSRPFLLRVYQSVPAGPQQAAAISQVYEVVLQRMIEEELEDAAASKAGIVITSQEIDESLKRVAAQNNLTVSGVLAEAKRSGMTVQQYRDELRRQVLQAKLVNVRLQGRIRVTDSDLRAAYKRIEAEERMRSPQRTLRLVLPVGRGEAEQAKQLALAESLSNRARGGDDLQTLIDSQPPFPGSGLYPERAPAQETPAVQRASLALAVGEVSRPVRVDDTWVIFQVTERPPTQLPPFEEVREPLSQRVYMEKMAKAREQWLAGLKRRTHVEVRM
ncbi:MAG TPA: peptidylprolyl isomerase [Polyangiaceae bacterium]|nr:peptidylprolyl isomerase [Polyangiaceae bacterium]